MKIKSLNGIPLIFGVDPGMASVGWGVLAPDHVVDAGVRCFPKGETEDGKSKNLKRRLARSARHRLRSRRQRRRAMIELLVSHGLIKGESDIQGPAPAGAPANYVWGLRVKALDELLSPEEWARAIYHIVNHRGPYWASKAEKKANAPNPDAAGADAEPEDEKKKEARKVTAAIAKNTLLLEDYRSVADMVVNKFKGRYRNTTKNYTQSVSREMLGEELADLFAAQRGLGNPHASEALEAALLDRQTGILWAQKPALTGEALISMVGRCQLELDEKRAPKASFTVERHIWLTALNIMKVTVDHQSRFLTEDEFQFALNLPYEQAGDLTYKQLRAAWSNAGILTGDFKFTHLRYPRPGDAKTKSGKNKNPEESAISKMPGWRGIRATLLGEGLTQAWETLSSQALSGQPEVLDRVAYVLSVYKEDDEVTRELQFLEIDNKEAVIDALLGLRFEHFGMVSLKALRKILPFMARQMDYAHALAEADYTGRTYTRSKYLPSIYVGKDDVTGSMLINEDLDVPANPVVRKAINQTIKVINAMIARYGSPASIHIECGRDLSKPYKVRDEIQKNQKKAEERKEKELQQFRASFPGVDPFSGGNMRRWQLYLEQGGICLYSGAPLSRTRLMEIGYVEIDHALPHSRSFDDSHNNLVLVLARENQEKGNMTPFEYLGGGMETERWKAFEARVKENAHYSEAKKNQLLKRQFGPAEMAEWKARHLNDTRWISIWLKNFIENHLQFAEGGDEKCVVLSGKTTSVLRSSWRLQKDRAGSDRHHAQDALVIAACTRSMVQKISNFSRTKELSNVKNGFVDPVTGEVVDPAKYRALKMHFPMPWKDFSKEVRARVYEQDAAVLTETLAYLGTYSEEELEEVKPLFVSRAVKRLVGGEVHGATIYSKRLIEEGIAIKKVALHKLKMDDLDNIVGKNDPRMIPIVDKLRNRLEAFGGDAEKAFKDPFYMGKNGKGSLVKSIKIEITKKNGFLVSGGIAEFGDVQSVDVYLTKKGYKFVPVYQTGSKNLLKPIEAPEGDREFTLSKGEYLKVHIGGRVVEGYFLAYSQSDNQVHLLKHDRLLSTNPRTRITLTKAKSIEVYHVDTLGNAYLDKTTSAQKEGDEL